jgi:REP-associated tyrosine transposase
MGNHFHLVFDTPGANIAAGMQHLKSTYALWFNDRRPREGCLFERRYFSRIVETELHAAEVCRYVVLNPVRARMCLHPADWSWSSYRPTAGIVSVPPFLRCDFVHGLVGGQRNYASFVAAGLDAPRVS